MADTFYVTDYGKGKILDGEKTRNKRRPDIISKI